MSKCIYYLKIRLLSKVFCLTEEEKEQTDQLVIFIMLIYAKLWFTSSLASSAASNDLDFMSAVMEYRQVHNKLAFMVLKSCYRHTWYLTPQLITLALTGRGLEEDTREKMAVALHSKDKEVIKTGKPKFPVLSHGPIAAPKDMASLVTSSSWLVFDILKLQGPQDWLITPATSWHLAPEFKALQMFAQNLTVVNDLAERGIHMATDYINRVQSVPCGGGFP